MSEEDIRSYLGRQAGAPPAPAGPAMRVTRRAAPRPPKREAEGYRDFSATHLLCPTCRRATEVRERIMLYLPDGDLYEYSCTVCGTSVGTRKAGR
jgi:hypothetical protein